MNNVNEIHKANCLLTSITLKWDELNVANPKTELPEYTRLH